MMRIGDKIRQLGLSVICLAAVFWMMGASFCARADTAYGYILEDSSLRTISQEEIADMPLQVVCYAKNEIYARCGRMFQSAELQNYFSQQYWYTALYQPDQFTPDMLNTYEQQNIDLLGRREAELGTYALDNAGYTYEPVYAYIEAKHRSPSVYAVDPDCYIFYDSDRRYLEDGEIAQLSLQELCFARYEIYARHGAIFSSQELSDYFGQKNWYWGNVPMESFPVETLNDYEAQNVARLLAAEQEQGGYTLDQPGFSFAGIGSYTDYYAYSDSAQDYVFWDSSIRYLTEDEVAGLSLQQLCYARNEIYARRGYIFQSQELRDYFGAKNWYHGVIPAASFSLSVFNEYETANIDLLKSYEYSISPDGYQLY